MGKLNIAHHKSYHPYRRDNIERVRKDEEEARRKEASEEGRMMLADSEARMDLLRQRAGLSDKPKTAKDVEEQAISAITAGSSGEGTVLPTTNGHINLFQDLEQSGMGAALVAKKADAKASEQGVRLAPDEKEMKRWYTQRRGEEEQSDTQDDTGRGNREAQRKHRHDPLTSIEQQLATRAGSSSSNPPPKKHLPHRPPSSSASSDPSRQARLNRESSERERALALIQRRKKEMQGSATPSTVYGDDVGEGYRDVYNRQEVDEAHRERERRRDRGWGDDRSGRHRRRDW